MITTRNIRADIAKPGGKLGQATTKDIDASPPKVENPNLQKTPQVSTHNIEDVADIQEKQRRDAIMAEKIKPEDEEVAVSYDGMSDMETISLAEAKRRDAENDKGFNLQCAIVEIDELLQGVPRRELK